MQIDEQWEYVFIPRWGGGDGATPVSRACSEGRRGYYKTSYNTMVDIERKNDGKKTTRKKSLKEKKKRRDQKHETCERAAT